ncbi:MAG: response regulator transcription factor [Bacteroidales bacterium]|nr:response regulator transcription factor [Bacteroidota bacterium]MBL6950130.1 response regulator transcription factor [Bacteroidales bacterium]
MRILIVDDHVLIRKGFKSLLNSYNPGWEVYEAINGIQAIIKAPKIRPDVVLMDFSMPKLDGLKTARQMIKDYPGIKIIMISGFLASENIQQMLDSGILGIVPKSAGTDELLEAIFHVVKGKQHLTVESSMNLEMETKKTPRRKTKKQKRKPSLLTPREMEVLQLLVKGLRAEIILQQLAISQRTLNSHKASIFKKCNVHSTVELVRYAYKNSIV